MGFNSAFKGLRPAASRLVPDDHSHSLLHSTQINPFGSEAPYYSLKSKASDTFSEDKGKGKAIPLQAWTDPESSRRLRLPDFKTIGT